MPGFNIKDYINIELNYIGVYPIELYKGNKLVLLGKHLIELVIIVDYLTILYYPKEIDKKESTYSRKKALKYIIYSC